MGLLRGIKNVINKNSAAIVVRNLLEIEAKEGSFFGDLASTPNLMVAAAWRKTPQLLDGSSGLHPHKISVVAATFASGIDDLEQSNPNLRCFITCLIKALDNAAKNSNTYPLNAIDNQLLGAASKFLTITCEKQLIVNSIQRIRVRVFGCVVQGLYQTRYETS